jgi:hypothetical protein
MKLLAVLILTVSAVLTASARPRLFRPVDTGPLIAKLEQAAAALDRLQTISKPHLDRKSLLSDLEGLIGIIDTVQQMERDGQFAALAAMCRDLEGRKVILRIIARRM